MRVDFAASVAKDPEAEELNEDRYLFSLDGRVAILSDGASESFDSRSWAELLCERSCEDGAVVGPEFVAAAVQTYSAKYDPAQLSWSKAAAHERGSFATLLVVKHNVARSEIEVTGIGDTVMVLCDLQNPIWRFPLTEPVEFQERPALLSTRDDLNGFLHDPQFDSKHVAVKPVRPQSIALMLTDALGCWCYTALADGRDDWRQLLTVESPEDFRNLVLNARAAKSMRLDDTTLIRLSFESGHELPRS